MSILTVGCSFTAGEELSQPTQTAWPALVAQFMNKPVTNMGVGGGSNDYIFRTVIEETAKQPWDLVVVEWSEPSRMEVWWERRDGPINVTAHSRYAQMGEFAWLKDFYATAYSDFHAFRRTAVQCLSLQEYLKSINQRYIFVTLNRLDTVDKLDHIWSKIDTQYFLGWPDQGLLDWQGDCPRGPGGHPLELGHQRIAEKINEHIRNLGWVS